MALESHTPSEHYSAKDGLGVKYSRSSMPTCYDGYAWDGLAAGRGLRKYTEEDWSDHMAERMVEIGEAAKLLGISSEAVRKRIKRGSLKAQKNGDGQWLVILDESRVATATRGNGGDGAQTDAASVATTMNLVRSSAAIEETLRDEIDVLRDEVGFLREEISRLETIIVSLTQNVKMLDAPRQPQLRMSWWHRLKSKFIGS